MRIVTKAVWRLLNNRHLLHFVNSLKISPSWNVHSKRTQNKIKKLKKQKNKTSNPLKIPPATKQNAQVPVRCAKYAWSTVSVHSQKTQEVCSLKTTGFAQVIVQARESFFGNLYCPGNGRWASQSFDIHVLTLKLQMPDDEYNNIIRENACTARSFQKHVYEEHQ